MAGPTARLQPSVTRPKPRLRPGFIVALLLAVCAAVVALLVRGPRPDETAASWWEQRGHAHCTPLEVEVFLRDANLGPGERAMCYAIAGKIDEARGLLVAMTPADRERTVSQIFAIAHPIADAGDDASAGPIMLLVADLQPRNFMALYHAGMAEYALGHDAVAKAQLTRFLELYSTEDGWRTAAENALAAIARRSVPPAPPPQH